MAKVRFYDEETDREHFPGLCLRCGAGTDRLQDQRFAWNPGWAHIFILAGALPWLIAVLLTRKTMRVAVPMCDRHRNHWRNQKLYIWLGLLGLIALGIVAAATFDELPKEVAYVGIGVLIFGSLGWLIGGLVLASRAIRAGEITAEWIELIHVDRAFAEEWREVAPPEPEPRRRRRRQRPVSRRRDDNPWDRGRRGHDPDEE
jgi:hypothetical protein